jgi:uncharacterized protein YkwD
MLGVPMSIGACKHTMSKTRSSVTEEQMQANASQFIACILKLRAQHRIPALHNCSNLTDNAANREQRKHSLHAYTATSTAPQPYTIAVT